MLKKNKQKIKKTRFAKTVIESTKREQASFLPNFNIKKVRKDISCERIRTLVSSRLEKNEVQQLQKDLEIYGVTQKVLEDKFVNAAHDVIRWGILSPNIGPLFFIYSNFSHKLFHSMLQDNEEILDLLFLSQIESENWGKYNSMLPLFKDKLKILLNITPEYIKNFIRVKAEQSCMTEKIMGDINDVFKELSSKYKLTPIC